MGLAVEHRKVLSPLHGANLLIGLKQVLTERRPQRHKISVLANLTNIVTHRVKRRDSQQLILDRIRQRLGGQEASLALLLPSKAFLALTVMPMSRDARSFLLLKLNKAFYILSHTYIMLATACDVRAAWARIECSV